MLGIKSLTHHAISSDFIPSSKVITSIKTGGKQWLKP